MEGKPEDESPQVRQCQSDEFSDAYKLAFDLIFFGEHQTRLTGDRERKNEKERQ